jgi:uncharacterized OB-fold protein
MHVDDDDEEITPRNHKFRVPDDEDPDERDLAVQERESIKCRTCGKWYLEDAPRCPYCKDWPVEDETERKPLWFVLTVVFCLLIAIVWAIRG